MHKEDGVNVYDDDDAQFQEPSYSDAQAEDTAKPSEEMPKTKKTRVRKSDLDLAAEGAGNIAHGIGVGVRQTGEGFNIVKNKLFPDEQAMKSQELAKLQADVQRLQGAKQLDAQIEALKKQKAELEKKDKLAMA